MYRKVIIQKHQTVLDIALQYCGSADALFDIAALNDLELTDEVQAGTALLVPEVIDKKKEKYLSAGDHRPVTGSLDYVEAANEGLEYWGLEIDFIIN